MPKAHKAIVSSTKTQSPVMTGRRKEKTICKTKTYRLTGYLQAEALLIFYAINPE
jgi:hypothetical protein